MSPRDWLARKAWSASDLIKLTGPGSVRNWPWPIWYAAAGFIFLSEVSFNVLGSGLKHALGGNEIDPVDNFRQAVRARRRWLRGSIHTT